MVAVTAPLQNSLTTEVADGVFRAAIPIPGPLRHANAWLLREADSWAIVDCGSDSEAGRDAWEELRGGAMEGRPGTSITVTHGHPDHIGLAAPLADAFGLTVAMTLSEWQGARLRLTDLDTSEAFIAFYRSHGCDEATARAFGSARAAGRSQMAQLPSSIVRLRHGDILSLGGREWSVIVAGGHSPEHAMLYAEPDRILIAGDQLLPRITPFVGVEPSQPNADPLGEYIASLELLAGLPDDVLVLPGHGAAFVGPAARANETRAHHDLRLEQIEALAVEPISALDCAKQLFPRAFQGSHARLAFCEALAHVNYLVCRGRLTPQTGSDGVTRFAV
jgi:glyoxylase-like metal-dependent hydrolase (beta-lactamase superfamily II)